VEEPPATEAIPDIEDKPTQPAQSLPKSNPPGFTAPQSSLPQHPPSTPVVEDKTVKLELNSQPPRQQPTPPVAKKQTFEPVYSLVGLSGQYKGKVKYIDAEEFTVGRDHDCCLTIDRDEKGRPDSSISRTHFVITTVDEQLYLIDRVSKLRTFINDKMIETDQRESITPEDIISIHSPGGEIKFRVCYADDPNPYYSDDGKKVPWLWIAVLILLIAVIIVAWVKFL